MKNLGEYINTKDIPRRGDVFEIPYGSVLSVPKHIPTPRGFIEWGTQVLADEYPHLVSLFGTTNIKTQLYIPNLTNNSGSSEFYIDENMSSIGNTKDQINDLYKIFNLDENDAFILGDGSGANQYKNISIVCRGTFVTDFYNVAQNIEYYAINTTLTQSNESAYSSNLATTRMDFSGFSTTSQNSTIFIQPNEILTENTQIMSFVSSYTLQTLENQYFTISIGASAKTFKISNISFVVPMLGTDTYINIPSEWFPGVGINNLINSKRTKLIMYLGDKVE